MRCVQVQKEDDLTAKIGRIISDKRRSFLSKADVNCIKQLWDIVNASRGQFYVIGQILSNIGDVNFINKYFTDIDTDAAYDRLEVTKYLFNDLAIEPAKVKCIEDFEMQRTLAEVCKTSSGDDSMLPYWLFKHYSYAFAPIVSHICSLSFCTGRPPKAWDHAIISPVSKVSLSKVYHAPCEKVT